MSVRVAVVGGGVIGACSAYYLGEGRVSRHGARSRAVRGRVFARQLRLRLPESRAAARDARRDLVHAQDALPAQLAAQGPAVDRAQEPRLVPRLRPPLQRARHARAPATRFRRFSTPREHYSSNSSAKRDLPASGKRRGCSSCSCRRSLSSTTRTPMNFCGASSRCPRNDSTRPNSRHWNRR